MKKLWLSFWFIILVVSFAGCQSKTIPDVEHTIGFYHLFGESTDNVTKNIDFGTVEGVANGNQTTYTFGCADNDEGFVKKQLVFYHDVLMTEETYFDDVKKAYHFAKQYRGDFQKNFGEKDTYPGVSSSNTDYLDHINNVESLKDNCTYYEDYTVTVSNEKTEVPWLRKEKAEKMLGEQQYSRIDLRLELHVKHSNSASVAVRYVVIP